MPKVTVILTSYNHREYIQEAIDSVLAQTYADFELIIWDDASTDDSWFLISNYSDSRIRAYRNELNSGPVMGMNRAIFHLAQGEYIAIHHSDDIWESEKLKKQVDFLDAHKEIGAVFTHIQPIDERGEIFTDPTHFYHGIFDQPNRSRYEWLRFFFLNGNALCHPSILIRQGCYEECGPYIDIFAQVPDWDMWVRLCARQEIHVLPERLVRFRVHQGGMNASGDRRATRVRWPYEYYKVLQRFRVLAGKDTVFEIFPEFRAYDRGEDTDVEYVLARVCLESGNYFIRNLLATEILFEIFTDATRRRSVEENYGVSLHDILKITEDYEIFSRDEIHNRDNRIAALEKIVADKDTLIANLNDLVEEILGSRSWRLTEPLRRISSGMRMKQAKVKKLLGQQP